jgi:hypothetical protein
LEDFTGNLISVENNALTFYFSNLKNDLFNNDISVVTFRSDGNSDKWESYEAELFDLVDNGRKTVLYGVRADLKQTKTMYSGTIEQKRILLQTLIDKYEVELMERNILADERSTNAQQSIGRSGV